MERERITSDCRLDDSVDGKVWEKNKGNRAEKREKHGNGERVDIDKRK